MLSYPCRKATRKVRPAGTNVGGVPLIRIALFMTLVALASVACEGDGERNEPLVTFEDGVASGDVTNDGAVLWTRAQGAASVTAEVATDPSFDGAVTLEAETAASRDFTVKVRATDLDADTRYYYRFRSGDTLSPEGTFVTAPDASVSKPLRFVFSGDSDGARLEDGTPPFNEFEVLDAAAADDPAFFLYFGDTIYADTEPYAEDLAGFRRKYRENRGYEALRNILAATSTYNMWDDHEVYNDYAGTEVDAALFEEAEQAFREYMPIDDEANPDTLYRTFRWGADLEMIVLDERSYRDYSAVEDCREDDDTPADPLPAAAFDGAPDAIRGIREFTGLPEELPPGCQETIKDPDRTMLGARQKEYLFDWLSGTDATWKVIVNPVPIQSLLFQPYDRWEGYAAEREEILTFIRDEGIDNVVFLTTDFHANIFGAVRVEPLAGAPVAYEAVAGPIAKSLFKADIADVVGEAGADAVDGFLRGLLQVDCAVTDAYSYGLVEVGAERIRISARDDTGDEMCSVELEAKQ